MWYSVAVIKIIPGQTKSKRFFQADVSSKKQTNEFYFTTIKPQVDLFLFVFWRKLKTPKKTFRNYLTFRLRSCGQPLYLLLLIFGGWIMIVVIFLLQSGDQKRLVEFIKLWQRILFWNDVDIILMNNGSLFRYYRVGKLRLGPGIA